MFLKTNLYEFKKNSNEKLFSMQGNENNISTTVFKHANYTYAKLH